jgi:hypothetical protein
MSNSHSCKKYLPDILKSLPDTEIKRLDNDELFNITKLTLLRFCIMSPFPGTKKWPANHPIWDCNVAGKMSPKEAWNNPQMLIKAIDNLYDMLRKGIFDYTDWVKKVQNALYKMKDEILEIVLYRFTIAKIAPKVTALMPTAFIDIIEKSNIDVVVGVCEEMKDMLNQVSDTEEKYYFENKDKVADFLLNKLLQKNDIVLIKGARYSSKLYQVTEELLKRGK